MKDPSIARTMRQSDLVVDDEKLSMAAKGAFLVLDLLGKRASVTQLADFTSDSAGALDKSVEELCAAGYVTLNGGTVAVRPRAQFGLLESAAEPGSSSAQDSHG